MNDELDTKTDAELEQIFELEVAGLEPLKLAMASADGGKSGALFEDNRYQHHSLSNSIDRRTVEEFCRDHPQYKVVDRFTTREQYCQNANAVLPWLEKRRWHTAPRYPNQPYSVAVQLAPGVTVGGVDWDAGQAPTFARAAVIALIRASRAAKAAA